MGTPVPMAPTGEGGWAECPWARRLLAVSGALPLLLLLTRPPSPTLLSYSVFVAVCGLRGRLCPALARLRAPAPLLLIPLIIGAGLLTEVFAWADSYLRCEPAPALFHPQLGPDLIHGLGFYGSWGITWAVLLRFYRFGIGGVFAIQGLYGVLIEQQGAILLAGLAGFPSGLVLWAFVLAVYGATAATPYALIACRLETAGRRNHWSKYPVALLTLGLVLVVVGLAWAAVLDAGGLLPPPRPICEHPFW